MSGSMEDPQAVAAAKATMLKSIGEQPEPFSIGDLFKAGMTHLRNPYGAAVELIRQEIAAGRLARTEDGTGRLRRLPTPPPLVVGDLVRKVGGYPFPGRVEGKFVTSARAERFNVESTVLPGLIHIFAGHQLVRDDGSDAIRVALDTLKREGVDVVEWINRALLTIWRLAPDEDARAVVVSAHAMLRALGHPFISPDAYDWEDVELTDERLAEVQRAADRILRSQGPWKSIPRRRS